MWIKGLILAGITIWAAVLVIPDAKLHVIFCDVGQGDATLITYKTDQLLVDGGPGRRVLSCLEEHMPFYDRTIEAVVLTHDQTDHGGGLVHVRELYNVIEFEPKIRKGDVLRIGKIEYQALSPDARVLGASTVGKENNEGIVGKVVFGDFDVLLTADVETKFYPDIGSGVEVVKVPHHGSKYGLDPEWWKRQMPKLAVVSAGKNNRYGHPTPEVIKVLDDLGIDLMRTDAQGEIEIVSDGVNWQVK